MWVCSWHLTVLPIYKETASDRKWTGVWRLIGYSCVIQANCLPGLIPHTKLFKENNDKDVMRWCHALLQMAAMLLQGFTTNLAYKQNIYS